MEPIVITSENFEEEVVKSDKPVLLDFWAPWCGPCKMLSPVVDKVAEETEDIKVGKVNVDDNRDEVQDHVDPHSDRVQGRRRGQSFCRSDLQVRDPRSGKVI